MANKGIEEDSLAFNNPEIIMGLVGAIGTKLQHISEIISNYLIFYNYNTYLIRVSNMLIPRFIECKIKHDNEYTRIDSMMRKGTKTRELYGNEILAFAACEAIRQYREEDCGKELSYFNRRAYIINSLKHPEEVKALREIYGKGFYLIGVYSDENKRKSVLMNEYKISKTNAEILIEKDRDEKTDYGQKTSDTFHLSDLFISSEEVQGGSSEQINRFISTIFSHPYQTPTFEEFAMFMAYSSSFRSADLSRQVGAVIAKNNEIIATGANDCPKYGGGLYWPNKNGSAIQDHPDGRDYMRGYDSNEREKKSISSQIAEEIFPYIKSDVSKEDIINIIKNGPINDITEYGRVVHAEMEALLSCARNGIPTLGGTLYCTTFPCHNCTKHIIAAGIKRVVYIEPYPKSKAFEFHSDAIELGLQHIDKKVSFEPFIGMGPRRFKEYFSMSLGTKYKKKRKEDGKIISWKKNNAILREKMIPSHYIERERFASSAAYQETEGSEDERREKSSESQYDSRENDDR